MDMDGHDMDWRSDEDPLELHNFGGPIRMVTVADLRVPAPLSAELFAEVLEHLRRRSPRPGWVWFPTEDAVHLEVGPGGALSEACARFSPVA